MHYEDLYGSRTLLTDPDDFPDRCFKLRPECKDTQIPHILMQVHAYKQLEVQTICDTAPHVMPAIKRIRLFGSALTQNCAWDSDTDLYVEFEDASLGDGNDRDYTALRPIRELCSKGCDILTGPMLKDNEHMMNVIEKGLVIFERLDTSS